MQQPRGQHVRRTAIKRDQHIAVLLVKMAHQRGEVAALVAAHIAHTQRTGQACCGIMHALLRAAHTLQDRLGVL